MRNKLRSGTIFELGPDGYGYILDNSEPGRSYAFQVDQILDLVSVVTDFRQLEGAAVSFRLSVNGQIEEVSLTVAPCG